MNPSDSEPTETEHSTADDAPVPTAVVTQPALGPAAGASLSPAPAVHSEGAATSSSTTKDHTLGTSGTAASPSEPDAAPRSDSSPTASPAADTAGGVSPSGGSGAGAISPPNATDDASAASPAASSTTMGAAQPGSSQPPQLLAQASSTAPAAEQVAGSAGAPAGEQAAPGPGQQAPPTEPQLVQSGSPAQQAAQQGNPGGQDDKPLQLAAPTAPQADAAQAGAPQQMAPQSGNGAPPTTGNGDGGSANNNKTLKVEDALAYLEHVKKTFHNMPKVYSDFLDIMKAFKNKDIDTPGVIHRVSTLFCGHKDLILQFNTFLPAGYKIKEADLTDRNHPAYVGPEQTYGTGPLPPRMGAQPPAPSQQLLLQQQQHQHHHQHQHQ